MSASKSPTTASKALALTFLEAQRIGTQHHVALLGQGNAVLGNPAVQTGDIGRIVSGLRAAEAAISALCVIVLLGGEHGGVVYTQAMGAAAYAGRVRTVALRNTGSAISPMNAFLILQGMQTLPLRMERHCDNALTVARYLQEHPMVEWVNFAGLPDSPYYDLAQKYTGGKPSALLTFGIRGGFDAGVKFYDALQLFLRLVNIGDVKSLAAHPASTTHRQLSGEELAAAGVTPDMIRLCIGIEDIEDIIADLEQALDAAR